MFDRKRSKEQHAATPYLVVPCTANDDGTKRSEATQAFHSTGIKLVSESTGAAILFPKVGEKCSIIGTVVNYGATGAYSALAEFYISTPDEISNAINNGTSIKPVAYKSAVISPGKTIEIACPAEWVVDNPAATIMVQVYDPIMDRLVTSYDALLDRHVGRKDLAIQGLWVGSQKRHNGDTNPIKMNIQQKGNQANINIDITIPDGTDVFEARTQSFTNVVIDGENFKCGFKGTPNLITDLWEFNLVTENSMRFKHTLTLLVPKGKPAKPNKKPGGPSSVSEFKPDLPKFERVTTVCEGVLQRS